MHNMKIKRVMQTAALLCAVVLLACLLANRHGSTSRHQRINNVSNRKQVGLAFRMGRNDLNAQFTLTGSVVTPNIRTNDR